MLLTFHYYNGMLKDVVKHAACFSVDSFSAGGHRFHVISFFTFILTCQLLCLKNMKQYMLFDCFVC